DALAYCEARTMQDRIKAAARHRPPANMALRDEIHRLFASDQAVRVGDKPDPSRWPQTDREHAVPLMSILNRYGVPTYTMVGPEAASEFAIMIQHQPPEFRTTALPKLKANV